MIQYKQLCIRADTSSMKLGAKKASTFFVPAASLYVQREGESKLFL